MEPPEQRQTVFVVDDDPVMLRVIEKLLLRAGYEVVAYASPRRFLEELPPGAAGCVVLDLRMPGMDGLQVQRALEQAGSKLSVVFASGHGRVPDAVRAMKDGAVDFLSKPVDAALLCAAVGEALARNRAARASQAERETARARFQGLTPQEQRVARLVARGLLSKQIAADLGIAEQTVRLHRSRLMHKLALDSIPALVRLLGDAEP